MKASFVSLFISLSTVIAGAEPIQVYPVEESDLSHSLSGDWAFKHIPGLDAGGDAGFSDPSFEVSAWKTIRVPGHWELQGFSKPGYSLDLPDALGLYRREFEVPPNWSNGLRVCLRFDGVAFGYRVWVNGSEVGASDASAFNPHTFDITDALRIGGANVLAVEVTTKPHGWKFDTNDDWTISGIFRDVTVFSVPSTHLQDVVARSTVSTDGSADLSVEVSVNAPGAKVHGSLLSPDRKEVARLDLRPNDDETVHAVKISVRNPELWTAETPSLYQLRLTLADEKGGVLQQVVKRIGLREVSIDGMRLLLNGRPIKMRGVTHHDLDPITGRSLSEDQMRVDLDLMRKANINFIRTSHYPPDERFLDLCDEMGFYVMDEVPLASRGGEYLEDPDYRENILRRTEATVLRDRSHPSVIVWSVGNENHMNEGEITAIHRLKELDPTRPVTLPKTAGEFGSNRSRYPVVVDVFAAHYPKSEMMEAWTTRLKRPTIFTEYAHAQGLATERIESQWEIIQATPQYAGGSIWHFHDQGILRKSEESVNPAGYTVYAWPDADHYYDTGEKLSTKTKGIDGADGIVYADRTPQSDYWEVRKVYSPVQIVEKSAKVDVGPQKVSATIENRHDFRSLEGMKLAWALLWNGQEKQNGEIALSAGSQAKETVKIPVNIPSGIANDALALELRCIDEDGLQLTERVIRLVPDGSKLDGWLASLPAGSIPQVKESKEEVTVRHDNFEVTVKRDTGELSVRDDGGRVLVSGVYPHPGRKRMMVDRRGSGSRFGYWPDSVLRSVDDAKVEVSETGAGVRLTVSGSYPRPRDSKQKFEGGYTVLVTARGTLGVRYRYEPVDAKGKLAEAGLSMAIPSEFGEFRWIGEGPHAGYPGKERLNEFGLFHLNRADLRFQGNRRRTEAAMLTAPEGAGLLLLSSPSDVAVERDEKRNQTLFSHNALISSQGNKLGGAETMVSADKTKEIAGSFTLVPLGEQWPAAVVRWFGEPTPAKDVFKPFYHSYDQ